MNKRAVRPHAVALLVAIGAIVVVAMSAPASAQHVVHRSHDRVGVGPRFVYPVAPGELGRLADRYRDYYYRNSNGNVFRSSRQFSPVGNVFRSSRHYQQKLAASYDGYPVRTYDRYVEGIGPRARERVFSYAHHGQGYPVSLYPPEGFDAEPAPPGEIRYVYVPVEVPARPRTRAEIPMEPVRLEPARPTQRAVMETETLPDGRTRMVIRSVPIEDETDGE